MSWFPRFLLLVISCGCAGTAQAHTMSVSRIGIVAPQTDDAPVLVDIDLSIRDLALTIPLDIDGNGEITWREMMAARAEIEGLVLDGVLVEQDRKACPLSARRFALRRYDEGTYAAILVAATCAGAGDIRLQYRLFFQRDPQHRALATIQARSGVTSAVATPASTWIQVGGRERGAVATFLREGVHHILIGYDHIAFLLSLLLPVVLVRVDRRWEPAGDMRSATARAALTVTAFTLAHSVTLSLAALGLVRPASAVVEAAIAASVLLAALNNVWPLLNRRLWIAAFAFGLVHGFGFAGALTELGLPETSRLGALLGFNLGVEIGQLAIVLAVVPILFAARVRPWYARWAMPAASLGIAALAAWWLYTRLTGAIG